MGQDARDPPIFGDNSLSRLDTLKPRHRVRCDVAADLAQQMRLKDQADGYEHRPTWAEIAALIERVNKP